MTRRTARALSRLVGPTTFALAVMAGTLLICGVARAGTLRSDGCDASAPPATSVCAGGGQSLRPQGR